MSEPTWRQQRLQALADKFGGNAELGRKLGYQSGAHVGQMISGHRSITEKTIAKAEALQGCRGWFSRTSDSPADETPPQDDFAPLRPPTLDEAVGKLSEVLSSLNGLGRELAGNLLAALAKDPKSAASTVETLDFFIKTYGLPPADPPTPAGKKPAKTQSAETKRSPKKTTLVLKIGGGQKQQFDLPLTRSAFNKATAPKRELAWYEQLKTAPKAASKERVRYGSR